MSVQEIETAILRLPPQEQTELRLWLEQLPPPKSKALRPIGLYAGHFVVPDDFDSPLPDDILRDFAGV